MELEELYALMERFARSGLTDLEWEREGEKIALRCAPAPVVEALPPLPLPPRRPRSRLKLPPPPPLLPRSRGRR